MEFSWLVALVALGLSHGLQVRKGSPLRALQLVSIDPPLLPQMHGVSNYLQTYIY